MTPNVLIATRSFGSTSPKPLEILHGAGCDLVHADMSLEMTEKRLIDLLKGAMEFDMKVLGTGVIDNFEKIKDMIPLGRSYSPVAEDANNTTNYTLFINSFILLWAVHSTRSRIFTHLSHSPGLAHHPLQRGFHINEKAFLAVFASAAAAPVCRLSEQSGKWPG